MGAFRRRREAPARSPHPDARIEAELQSILSLRSVIARKEALLSTNAQQITTLRANLIRHPTWDHAVEWRKNAAFLQRETAQVEAEVRAQHDEIRALMDKIDDTDLAYLDKHQRR